MLARRALWLGVALVVLLSSCVGEGATVTPPPDDGETPPPAVTQTVPPAPFALPWYGSGAPDPLGTVSALNLTVFPLIYEGLFALDHAFVPQPVLCTRAEMGGEGTQWTLFLRPDVFFSDGTPMTAERVRDCLRMLAAGGVYAPRLADVANIEAAEGRVVVTLRRPNARFPALLDLPIFLPDDPTIGTGPYLFTADALECAPDWWRGETLPVQRVELVPITSADALIEAFDSGRIALVTADLTGSNPLGYAGSYEVWDYPTTTMLYLGYQAARGPCADAALRRAIALCVDRATITASLLSEHATPAALPAHPAAWRDAVLEQSAERDIRAADALLDELGYTAGEDGLRKKGRTPLALTLLVNNENPFKLAIAEYLADDLSKRGIDVTLKRLGFEAYQAALKAGEFDLYLAECRMAPDFDPAPLIAVDGALNFGRYHNADTDALYAVLRSEGQSAAGALYAHLLADAPITPLCFKTGSALARWGRISGAAPSAGNVFYQVWQWKVT